MKPKRINHPEIKNILVFPDKEKTALAAAKKIVSFVRQKPRAVISYATGQSKVLVYKKIARMVAEGKADFSQTKAFHLDEYYPCHPQEPHSFVRYLDRYVFKPFRIKKENIFIINGQAEDPVKEASRYETLIFKNPIDLSILGIGPGAHIAFNEPGSSFDSQTRVVKLSEETIYRDQVIRKQKTPDQAVTQGIATILKAKNIIQIAYGEKYTPFFYDALWKEINPRYPSSALRLIGNKVTIMIDEMAFGF